MDIYTLKTSYERTIMAVRTKKEKMFVYILVAIIATAILSVIVHAIIKDGERNLKFASLLDGPRETKVSIEGKIYVVDEKTSGEFISISINSDEVTGHHSYPVNKIDVRINGTIYRLGADSVNKDEYWIHQIFEDNPNFNRTEVLRHFHSPRMTQWIKNIVVSKPVPAKPIAPYPNPPNPGLKNDPTKKPDEETPSDNAR